MFVKTIILLLSLDLMNSAEDNQSRFLEGFPDVPLLEGVMERDPDARFIFDTPTGTVAETVLIAEGRGPVILEKYNQNLGALGWRCVRQARALSCEREQNRLSIKASDAQKNSILLTVRLEPIEVRPRGS